MFCVGVLVAATVLAALGKLDSATWVDFMKYLTITLVASKTVTTAVETVTTKKPQNEPPEARAIPKE